MLFFAPIALLALSAHALQRASAPPTAAFARRMTPPLAQLPGSPKDVATEMSVSVGAALQEGQQRLAIVTPDELSFGLLGKPIGKQILGNPDVQPPPSFLARCERELAFLVVEMFQQYAGSTVVVFSDGRRVKAAEKDWKAAPIRPSRVVGSIKELQRPAGFGSGAKAGPPKVVIVSRPTEVALEELEPFAAALGSSAVVVLLNPQAEVGEGYFSPFSLLDNPHPGWAGGLLYHAHPNSWVLGAAGNSGAPKVHGTSKRRPTLDEIDAGFLKVSEDSNWFSGGGAAAALRRRGMPVAAE